MFVVCWVVIGLFLALPFAWEFDALKSLKKCLYVDIFD